MRKFIVLTLTTLAVASTTTPAFAAYNPHSGPRCHVSCDFPYFIGKCRIICD